MIMIVFNLHLNVEIRPRIHKSLKPFALNIIKILYNLQF